MTFHIIQMCFFVSITSSAAQVSSALDYVMVGSYTSSHCEYKPSLKGKVFYMYLSWDVDNALGYIFRNKLIRNSETPLYQKAKAEGFSLDRVDVHQKLLLTINRITLDHQNLTIICLVKDDDGRGAVVWKKTTSLTVIDPPRIFPFKHSSINVTRGTSEAVEFSCTATGFPEPTVRWWTEDLKQLVHPQTYEEATLTARYYPSSPFTSSQDGVYICEAVTNHSYMESIGVNKATRGLRFNVQYPPSITTKGLVIYTDIGVSVSVMIEVTGNPQPLMECSTLMTRDPKFVRARRGRSPHRFIYEILLHDVRPRHITSFPCSVENPEGHDSMVVHLQLGPSRPVILSPTLSHYSDYYALWWTAFSRAPLINVTVQLLKRNTSGDLMPFRLLNLPMYKTRYFHATSSNQTVLTHLTNLTSHSAYAIRVRTCNRHHCSDFSRLRPFRTVRYDGTNTVDPQIILRHRRRFLMSTTLKPSSIRLTKKCRYNNFGVYICSSRTIFYTHSPLLLLLHAIIAWVHFL